MSDDSSVPYGEKLRAKGVQLGAGTTPTRTRTVAFDKPHYNSWEAGIARRDNGMPYLDENLTPIGVKRFAERYKGLAEAQDERRALERLTAPDPPKEG